jgi:alpha-tubulin suppressor-like RCC1 family protein
LPEGSALLAASTGWVNGYLKGSISELPAQPSPPRLELYAWGNNVHGQLGDGTRTARYTPEQIDPTDLHDIIAVAASFASSYALSSDGTVWAGGCGRIR